MATATRKERTISPYYRKFDGWWYAASQRFRPVYGSDRVKLLKGPHDKATEQAAVVQLQSVLAGLKVDSLADEMPLCVLADKYLVWLKASGANGQPVKLKSFKQSWDFAQNFCKQFGQLTVKEFAKTAWNKMDEWLEANPGWKAPDTKRRGIKVIKSMLNYGHARCAMSESCLAKYPVPASVARVTIFTAAQEAAIKEALKLPRFRGHALQEMFFVLMETGARNIVEACLGFTAENVHYNAEGQPVAFDLGIVKKKRRYVWLTPPMRELVTLKLQTIKSGPLFRNRHGQVWAANTLQSRFARVRKYLMRTQPQLSLTAAHVLYSCRHSYIVRLLISTKGDVGLVAELAGNSIAVLEKHYKKWCANTDRLLSALGNAG